MWWSATWQNELEIMRHWSPSWGRGIWGAGIPLPFWTFLCFNCKVLRCKMVLTFSLFLTKFVYKIFVRPNKFVLVFSARWVLLENLIVLFNFFILILLLFRTPLETTLRATSGARAAIWGSSSRPKPCDPPPQANYIQNSNVLPLSEMFIWIIDFALEMVQNGKRRHLIWGKSRVDPRSTGLHSFISSTPVSSFKAAFCVLWSFLNPFFNGFEFSS